MKLSKPEQWNSFCSKVGGEESALRFDSRGYFNDAGVPKHIRCDNYAKTFFAFVETFVPLISCVAFTDHNYQDTRLIDSLLAHAKGSTCKAIAGVEINVEGVHMLVLFGKPSFTRPNYSEGIKEFLSSLDVREPKTDGVLTVCHKSIYDVIEIIGKQRGIYIFPHCNSDNGLFQERGRTDRTFLANVFNKKGRVLLQTACKDNADSLMDYIRSNRALKAIPIITTASDARSLRDVGKSDEDGIYCWIKADPTFDGLKQLLYEPSERVALQEHTPEQKGRNLVIEKVRFLDTSPSPNFSDEWILLNPNLNSIIGGKSSGKSLLLYHIASAIDPGQVEKRLDPRYNLKYDFNGEFAFEVCWEDGAIDKLSEKPAEKKRTITYLPQMYINNLAEKGKEKYPDDLVIEILDQNEQFRSFYQDSLTFAAEIVASISTEIIRLFSSQSELIRETNELRTLGDRTGIKREIDRKQKEIESLRSSSGFSEPEESEYQRLSTERASVAERISLLETRLRVFEDFAEHIEHSFQEFRDNIGSFLEDEKIELGDDGEGIEQLTAIHEALISWLDKEAPTKVEEGFVIMGSQHEELTKSKARLAELDELIQPYLLKVSNQGLLQELQDGITKEENKLKLLESKEQLIQTLTASISQTKLRINSNYNNLVDSYRKIVIELSKDDFKSISSDITLRAFLGMDSKRFSAQFEDSLDKRQDLDSILPECYDSDNNFLFNSEEQDTNIARVFEAILDSRVRLRSGRETKDAVLKLFEDYFIMRFDLVQNNDSIGEMSPGKRGLVLLKMYLHLSNADHPILIDQPEDNLDNRTIYDELNEFIREKKVKRQIIMVSHNANLVVSTDSEEVIVANQDGQHPGRDNKEFRFEYVSGALECLFKENSQRGILYQKGIREHVCEILEGGEDAFKRREKKYGFA
ncbi:MAG: hypothetical protein M1587_03605 [Thaumarchaeota archaeon]|nr:hypothetical protein [Nitrososphaerota archaeon]